jgi:signal peptidase I
VNAAKRLRGGWTALVISTSARCLLTVLAGLLLWSLLPVLIGWHATVVMSGSMQPKLRPGDVISVRPVSPATLRLGEILLVRDPDQPNQLRLHRLVARRPDGMLVLRGDANKADDSTPVAPAAVRGVAVLRLPRIGDPVLWFHSEEVAGLVVLGGALLALGVAAFLSRMDDSPNGKNPEAASGTTFSPPSWKFSGAASWAAAALVSAALVAAILNAAAPARAAFSAKTNTAGGWAAATYFTCRAADLAATPGMLYPLNESSGTVAADVSGNNLNGTYIGGISYGVSGSCARDNSKAVALNGSTGYITTPGPMSNPQGFSLEIWFKTTTSNGGKLIGFGSSQTGASTTTDRDLYMINTGKIAFATAPGGQNKIITSTSSYNNGSWHLADATQSSSTGMKLYVDGQLVASDPATTTARVTSGYWRFGYDTISSASGNVSSNFFAGAIDYVGLYPGALAQSVIQDHYNAAS